LRDYLLSLWIRAWNVNKADVFSDMKGYAMADDLRDSDALLFLTDEQLRRAIEAMFFAYRGFTADPDRILSARGYGRAHHRALHFIGRTPGTTVSNLLAILGVTKQSLNRVLRTLIEAGLVESRVGETDRRERRLELTSEGAALEAALSTAQRERMRAAFRAAGPDAVAGFREVLEHMMEPELRRLFAASKGGER
jgi:DNA-binding MarR family transcriptional regulator